MVQGVIRREPKCNRDAVLSKALREIHTWHGMIGYYMKDKFRPRYGLYHTANITFEDMQVAEDAY